MDGSSAAEEEEEEKLLTLFEQLCFTHGDADAIRLATGESLCYLELQELSILLASQLHYRFRPDVVLVDCYGHVVAETVSLLACLRLRVPFVPVSVYDQHAGAGRLNAVVQQLRKHVAGNNIVAICGAENDLDPALGIFYQADIHQVVYLDRLGNLGEQIQVPRYSGRIDPEKSDPTCHDDDLYILFTSGTSSNNPKAVVGSQKSTFRRLKWFRDTFIPSPRVARRTRLTFVDSITELFGALLSPPSLLVAVEPDELRDHGLESLLTSLSPTQITLLPSQLALLFILPTGTLSCLERVIVSGEPCPASLVHDAKEKLLPSCQLINLYGQTESTGDVLAAVLTDLGEQAIHKGVVAVGKPIMSSICVTTTTAKDELVIQGNLANGYLGEAPFEQFTTGDVGFCKDGIWYVKGRCDDVVKVNGVLTSPVEVETAFATLYNTGPVVAVIQEGQVYLVCEARVQNFSRHGMHEAGIPWNLIPIQVLHHSIPVSDAGAGKVNRAAARELVRQLVDPPCQTPPAARSSTLHSLVADILHLDTIDSTKSFVELGGDSASSIHLLYRLRQAKLMKESQLSTGDILGANSLNEIELLLRGITKRRRIEKAERIAKAFSVQPSKTFSEHHIATPLIACVDASAVLSDGQDCFYQCCQGGLVCKLNSNGTILGYRHFQDWKFEADCLLIIREETTSILICGYSDEGKGLVVALDQSLKQLLWQREFDSEVRRAPVLVLRKSTDEIWVRSNKGLVILNSATGNVIESVTISNESFGRAVVDKVRQTVWYTGIELTSISYAEEIVKVHEFDELTDTIGPSHKDGLLVDDKFLFGDGWGQVHVFGVDACKIQHTVHVASCPVSSPTLYGNQKRCFLVGSYDGRLMSFQLGDSATEAPKKQWEVQLGSAIYTKPLVLPNQTTCVVCTTAGEAVVICTSNQVILENFQVPGEIWSNPKIVREDESGDHVHVAFGARDSRVHIIKLKMETS